MKEQELRVGNYYIYKEDSEIQKIDDSYSLYLIAENIKDIEPIELTEGILLKCGFIPCSIIDNHFNISGMCIWKCNDMFLCDKNGVHIKYLHQLQNLYFALTNEELNIQL